jgi:serine/threonine-protein kinase
MIGRRLSHFRILDRIGEGGMGVVYRAEDEKLQRVVALKVLPPEKLADEERRLRFVREARTAAAVTHPNIAVVHEIDEAQGVVFIAMELIEGKTLRDAIGGKPMPLREALRLGVEIAEGLSAAHQAKVIHRDLKPDNVMVGSHGQVYLIDWGAAQLLGGDRPSDSQVRVSEPGADDAAGEQKPSNLGTPVYMAPEQAQGRTTDIDERTDVFGLGGILYYILTARAPFAAPSLEEIIALARKGEVAPPQAVAPGVRLPPGLCRITMRALAADPTLRHHSVEALKEDVTAFLRGGGWFQTLTYRAGTVIVHEGETPDAAYLINRGWCEAYKVVDGRKQSLRKMGPGDVFGETSIFTKQPRTASVVALDDVQLTEITLDAIEQECGPRSWMYALVKALAQRFLDLDRELTELRIQQDR